jgi:hypothetical protein
VLGLFPAESDVLTGQEKCSKEAKNYLTGAKGQRK